MVSDPAVARYMRFARWDEQKRRQWHARLVEEASRPHPGVDNWAITLRDDGRLIGWLFIGPSSDQGAAGIRGCGWALDQRYWSHGYTTEALRAAIAYEFTALGTQRIVAECQTENLASARVMQKCGMTYEGTFLCRGLRGQRNSRASLQHHRAGMNWRLQPQPGATRRVAAKPASAGSRPAAS
ncbi:MAG TPA: GNAT family N-acetyltransferase [Ktedonobacterales bacterium]